MGSHRASGLQSSRPDGKQPSPMTFERFMEAYRHLPAHQRERIFSSLPTQVRNECWAALQARLDRIRGWS